jgi:acyl carrier protein
MSKLKAAAVKDWIVEALAEYLDIPAEKVTPDAHFESLGLDSADAVILCGSLEEHFNVEIDAMLFLRNVNTESVVADLVAGGIAA